MHKVFCFITNDSFILGCPKEKCTLELPIEDIEIPRIPPKYVTPMCFDPVQDPNKPTLIFDLDGVLCRSFILAHSKSVPDLDVNHFNLLEEHRGHRAMYVPKDVMHFIASILQWASVYIWSCAYFERVESRTKLIFGSMQQSLSGIVGQQMCEVAKFSFGSGKPIFFKTLQNFLDQVQPSGDVLLIDDSLYKCRFNPIGSYIIVPEIEKRPVDFLTKELLPWLTDWRVAANRATFSCMRKAPASTYMDDYVEEGFKKGWQKMAYESYAQILGPLPTGGRSSRHHCQRM